ncbi:MAG: DUF4124 domain-containing protein [Pseudohaliea sp.]
MNVSTPFRAALLSVVLAVIATAALAADTLYRWKDDRGNLVVSDRPPEDSAVEYETVRMGANAMSRAFRRPADSTPPRSSKETDAPAGAGSDDADPMTRVDLPEKDPEKCATARENLKALETFARIRTKDENGEYYYLTEEDKERQREQARDAIRVYCE